jgi:hypothetical protein
MPEETLNSLVRRKREIWHTLLVKKKKNLLRKL